MATKRAAIDKASEKTSGDLPEGGVPVLVAPRGVREDGSGSQVPLER